MSKPKQPHRRWDNEVLESLACEHNALFHDWQDAKKELDRIGKVNGDLCDENFELKKAQTTTAPGTVTGWTCSTTEMEQAWIKSGNKIKGEWMFAMDYLRDKAIVAAPLGPEGRTAEQWHEYARNADQMLCREREKVQFLQDKLDRLPVAAPAPVPAGVPSAEELKALADRIHWSTPGSNWKHGMVSAIREAVLAGIQGEMQALRERAEKAVKAMGDQAEFWRLLNDAKIDGMVPTTNLCSAAGQLINLALASSPSIDHDAWKTPLVKPYSGDAKILVHCPENRDVWVDIYDENGSLETYELSPADAARAAVWLASYAAAHGHPVDLRHKDPANYLNVWEREALLRLRVANGGGGRAPIEHDIKFPAPEPEPVASPATIEALAEIAYAELWKHHNGKYPMLEDARRAVTAILRAAKPTLEASEKEINKWWRDNVNGTTEVWPGEARDLRDWLNSRIRWTMPKPEPIHPIYAEPKINCHGCGVTLPASALEKGYNPIVDGVRVAVCGRCWENKVDLPRRTYTAADVEALAKEMCRRDAHDEPHEDSWITTLPLDQDAYRHMARAAIAWFGGRIEG